MMVELSNGMLAYPYYNETAASITIYDREYYSVFFACFVSDTNEITVHKTSRKTGKITYQKVSKKDREYYINVLKNFILANTDFILDI